VSKLLVNFHFWVNYPCKVVIGSKVYFYMVFEYKCVFVVCGQTLYTERNPFTPYF